MEEVKNIYHNTLNMVHLKHNVYACYRSGIMLHFFGNWKLCMWFC